MSTSITNGGAVKAGTSDFRLERVYLASKWVRWTVLAIVVAIAVLFVALAKTRPELSAWSFLVGPLLSVILFVAFFRHYRYSEPQPEELLSSFEALSPAERKEALDLLWSRIKPAGVAPSFDLQSVVAYAFLFGMVALILTVGPFRSAIVHNRAVEEQRMKELREDETLYNVTAASSPDQAKYISQSSQEDKERALMMASEHFGNLRMVNIAFVMSVWLLAPMLSFAVWGFVQSFRFDDYVLRKRHFLRARRQRHLFELAEEWVKSHLPKWTEEGVNLAVNRAMARLFPQCADDVSRFPLLGGPPLEEIPKECPVVALLVGPYLAIRSGFIVDFAKTSYEVALKGGGVVAREDKPTEREVYYPDIVSVDYIRTTEGPWGTLSLTFVNGPELTYQTLEVGTESAIEAVRAKTRLAKGLGSSPKA